MSMQQLGLLARKQKDCTRDDDAFAAASEALPARSAAEPWQKKLGKDDVVPSIRTGQVDRFVYKSYFSLCNRRTSSLPVGKGHAAAHKMCIRENWDVEGHNKMGTTSSSSKNNFLSNAIKFTPAGGKLDSDLQCEEVTESIELHTLCKSSLPPSYPAPADPAEDSLLGATGSSILAKTAPQRIFTDGKVARIRFSVKDNGIGISADDQVKLFKPYSFVTSGWVQKSGFSESRQACWDGFSLICQWQPSISRIRAHCHYPWLSTKHFLLYMCWTTSGMKRQ